MTNSVSKSALTCVAVRELPLGILCEVKIIAYLGTYKRRFF